MSVSYGGYLALRSLVEQPRSFAGVVSINGVTDWLGLVNSNPNTISAADFDGPLTAENAAFYDRASVLAKVPQLADQKISLIHSRNDSSVSYSQSSVLAGILETAGKNVEFTTLDGENHVLSQRSSAATVCNVAFETMGLDPGDRCSLGEDL
jgi:dipeptidyl aminopeptidase/acylaminoacyl peptidase